MNLDFDLCEKYHKELWDWCAKTGGHKYSWPKWKGFVIDAFLLEAYNYCFACIICAFRCSRCPIQWVEGVEQIDDDVTYCTAKNSPYANWQGDNDDGEAAATIRDMLWVKK
jgi:hypothetical protein